ncbi:hypothetical protein [Arsenicicoccus sp. oral taxon 190]|uniref:hypothetical protein n=1 Tax=Arsenicicoccus sp. oral taxon 190 TaxID=1658671 RepID=UPI00067A0618|nr:hypothetical protein [Arsenicicoccus sp. oral taxon 190]AKT50339.1 hypothetical protein ADJ73_01620 [Arsenicicoccus sp. oral taxon 190]
MDISMESFHDGGTKRGAVLRRLGPTELRAVTVYRGDGGLQRVDRVLTHTGDVRDWTTLTVTTPSGSTSARRVTPTSLEAQGRTRAVPADTLPGCAGPVVLAQMLAGCHTEAEFHALDEADPLADPVPAHYSVGNPEQVTLPGQGTRELGSVTLYRDEEPTERHWFDSHEVVASDWQGPRTYHVGSARELLEGLDDEVAAVVREFIA